MAQSSEWKIGKYSEWFTELPIISTPRESPTFFFQDKECYFLFTRSLFVYADEKESYNLDLKTKDTSVELKPFRLSLVVLYPNGSDTIDVLRPSYTIFRHLGRFILDRVETVSKGKFIRFRFLFHNTDDPLSPCKDVHLKALSRDISKLTDDSSESDVKILCEDKTFHAHRIILGMRSTVLSAMLQSKMVEGETGLIKVEDFGASIVQGFLQYLYSGTLPNLEVGTAMQFYEIADKYDVEELKMACSEFFTKNLSKSNACAILVLADQHSHLDFRESVISYIIEKDIPRREKEWDDFCENYCKLANEVYKLYIQKKMP